jgi:acyl-phosphate glycerol 3-phosphate acyltransferase
VPWSEAWRAVLALAIGLTLGSILPADLLARRRGIDIRATGDGNPGTVNAFRVLGWPEGVVTAAYDLSVGLVAIQIARQLGLADGPAYVAGMTTVVGHRLPVFRGFRGGGEGMAASAGLLVYAVAVALARGWLSVADIVGLVAVLVVTFALTRSDSAASVIVLPALVIRLALTPAEWQFLAFTAIVSAYVWAVQVGRVRRWLASREARPAHERTRD